MTSHCIHGFRPDECASCRACPHGLSTARCGRCTAASASRQRPVTQHHAAHEHAGYEIYFEPAVSGWQYRVPGSAPSALSYRSSFLARKAVDQLAGAAPAAAGGGTAKRRS